MTDATSSTWLNPKHSHLAPEDGTGSSGGATPPPEAVTPPPPPTVEQQLAAMEKRLMEATQATVVQAVQALRQSSQQSQGGHQATQAPPDEPYIDPDAKAYLDRQLAARDQRFQQNEQRTDYLAFQAHCASMGINKETADQALAFHQSSIGQVSTVTGQPLSRIDALNFVVGAKFLNDQQKLGAEKARLDRERQIANMDATVERGSRPGSGGTIPPAPESREERQKTGFWSKVLDVPGGF